MAEIPDITAALTQRLLPTVTMWNRLDGRHACQTYLWVQVEHRRQGLWQNRNDYGRWWTTAGRSSSETSSSADVRMGLEMPTDLS